MCRHSELAAPLVCEERAIQGRVVRNRKDKIDKHRSGDPVGNQTFFTKSKILEKAVKQVQGDKKCRVGKVKRFPPQNTNAQIFLFIIK